MDEKLKERMARQMRRSFEMCRARDEAAKKRKEAKALNPELPADKDPDKANYKKNKFVKPVKTVTYRIVTGMKVTFKDGRTIHYKLGKNETIILPSKDRLPFRGMLLYDTFVSCIRRGFKKKVNDPETDIEFEYTEEERARNIAGSGFYDRK